MIIYTVNDLKLDLNFINIKISSAKNSTLKLKHKKDLTLDPSSDPNLNTNKNNKATIEYFNLL